MPSNRVRKEFNNGYGNWQAPAGVTQVNVQIIDKLDKLIDMRTPGGATGAATFALRRNNVAFATGRNINGQLGDGTAVQKAVLTAVAGGLSFVKVIPMGTESCFASRSDFSHYAWGIGTLGELGDNTILSKSSPTPIPGAAGFVKVTSRGATNFGLRADGSAWAWGNFNSNGAYGDNTRVTKSSPVPVVGGHSFVEVMGNLNIQSMALKADGSAWCWGNNSAGQLGDNTILDKSSPVQVVGGHSFTAIFEGPMALKANGSAWGWGTNSNGELGDNTILDKSSPVAVVGGHSFIHLVRASNTTLALKADGSAWAWGDNTAGILGRGAISGSLSSPVPVVGGHSFISIDAHVFSSSAYAMKSDGSVWSWGNNNFGQLGDGTSVNKSSPVAVVGGHLFTSISNAGESSAALKIDGSIWAWGRGNQGQLGDGTSTTRSSPVLMTGGLVFQTGSQLILEKTISVVPGTTYNMNVFLQNTNGVVIRSNPGNSLVVVLEYET